MVKTLLVGIVIVATFILLDLLAEKAGFGRVVLE